MSKVARGLGAILYKQGKIRSGHGLPIFPQDLIESFHIYCSWEGGRELERVQEKQFRFEELWHQLSPNLSRGCHPVSS